METINDRIKAVRKAEDLTQSEFGERIGVTKNAVVNMEIPGRSKISDNNNYILSICREFGVREEWLRTGNGSMKEDKSRDEQLKEAVERLLSGENSDFKRRFVTVLSTLNEKEWALLESKMLEIVGQKPVTAAAGQSSDTGNAPDSE